MAKPTSRGFGKTPTIPNDETRLLLQGAMINELGRASLTGEDRDIDRAKAFFSRALTHYNYEPAGRSLIAIENMVFESPRNPEAAAEDPTKDY